MAFNVALALVFIGLLDPLAWLLVRLFPARKDAADPAAPRYLDESALDTPSLALADAARETLRMGDIVEVMLRQVMTRADDQRPRARREVSRMDNVVDKLDEAIKLYVTKLTRGSLDEREGRRAMEIISFTINLEHIGDIIDKNLTRARRQEDQAQAPVLHRGRRGAGGLPQAHPGEPAHRARRVHVRRRRGGAQADRREGPAAQRRAGRGRAPLRAPARRPAARRWRRRRCTSTCCATSSASIRTSARSPIRCWRPPARCRPPTPPRATPSPSPWRASSRRGSRRARAGLRRGRAPKSASRAHSKLSDMPALTSAALRAAIQPSRNFASSAGGLDFR